MAKGIRFYEPGGPEVLRWESLPVGDPGPGEVRVRHVAVGLNFADTYFRSGLYPASLPAGMGVEAAGVVEAVGPAVTGFAAGDRVTYTGSPLGAYSTERVMDATHLIPLPDTIPFETAAAMTMRGLTCAYLLRRIADLPMGPPARRPGHRHRLHRREGVDRPRARLRGDDRLPAGGRRPPSP